MKLIYVIAAVAMLAMLIPAMAIPVSAQGVIKMFLVDPLNNTGVMGADLIPLDQAGNPIEDSGYNVTGSVVEIQVTGTTVTSWGKNDLQGTSTWVMPAAPTTETSVRISGVWGETDITATTPDGPLSVNKKWGQIKRTVITGNQSVFLTWNESAKCYQGAVSVKDTVYGDFIGKDGPFPEHTVQGVIFNWYLVAGDAVVPMGPAEAPALKTAIEGLKKPFFTQFGLPVPPPAVFPPALLGTDQQTVSGTDGASTVGIYANGAETVQVVVVPQYPGTPQLTVTTEVTVVNFKVRQLEVVPQVRWVGEKIVLEKWFGPAYVGYPVTFALENQSPGTLEPIGNVSDAEQSSISTYVDSNGLASCILKSDAPGEVNVEVALFSQIEGYLIENQHAFTVFYLKFAGVTLGNVVGKRSGHNSGLWTPANPWDPTGSYNGAVDPPMPDEVTDDAHHNVSADTLLRARVKGWFVNANMNPARPAPVSVDTNGDGTDDLVIPAWAWVLPDDWSNPALMGAAGRIHWDIMDNPFDSVVSTNPMGPYGMYAWDNTSAPSVYKIGQTVAAYRVIGPFSPGIELMTPTGWAVPNPRPDSRRQYQTVVPNGVKQWWDAPMPPAKITFKILNRAFTVTYGTQTKDVGKAGFFKPAMKTDIYYLMVSNQARPAEPPTMIYTNPFYFIMVPAHQAIPAFGNNEAYDWASFGTLDERRDPQGPYPFWTFVNVDEDPAVPTSNAQYPTIASVYSDNHGEAMVWLNGDWNLNLSFWTAKGGADVPQNTVVGETVVQVVADYPYARGHANYLSNTIEKIWEWGGLILGAYSHQFADESATDTAATRMVLTAGNFTVTGGTYPYQDGTSKDKVVWIWATDRDGKQAGVLGAEVLWNVGVKGPYILTTATGFISNYNDITQNTMLVNGFLAGTNGVILNGAARTLGASTLKSPKYAHTYVLTPPAVLPDGITPLTPAQQAMWRTLTAEEALFYKFFNKTMDPAGLQPSNFAVAAIDIKDDSGVVDCTVGIQIFSEDFGWPGTPVGMVQYETNVDFAQAYPLDDSIKIGDANLDNSVNMGDVTIIEKIILKLKASVAQADVNCDGDINMGDVVKLERQLLGLK